jgi:hypothetical protein
VNFQSEHYLFPAVCHLHSPALSTIGRQTCHEFAMPSVGSPTIRAVLGEHYRWLKTLEQGGGPRFTPVGRPQAGEGPDGARRTGVSPSRPASDVVAQ